LNYRGLRVDSYNLEGLNAKLPLFDAGDGAERRREAPAVVRAVARGGEQRSSIGETRKRAPCLGFKRGLL
jgi:hypothetical protein